MKWLLILCFLSIILPAVSGGGKPAANPLLMVDEYGGYGSDRHTFVSIYSDGTVIFLNRTVPGDSYRTLKASSANALLTELGTDALLNHIGRFQLSSATDQPGTKIWYKGKCISIYGDWRAPSSLIGEPAIDAREQKHWESLPREVREFCSHVDSYAPQASSEWHPDAIRITLEHTTRSPAGSPIVWPVGWPTPKTTKITPRDYGMISFDIPFQLLEPANEINDQMSHGRALSIDGELYHMWISLPIPGQEIWEKDHRAAFGDTMP